jgi:hypothetical protein
MLARALIARDEVVDLELDHTKRNCLHAVAGSEAARIGAGLFTEPQQ